jgi:hypothetical protein
MAVFSLTDCFVHVAGYDFTTDSNNAVLSGDAAALDKTTFGSGGWQELATGLKSTQFQMGGFWQSDTDQAVDPQAFAALGASKVVTFGPVETEGQPAYMFQALGSQYVLGGQVGDLAPFTLQAQGSDGQGVVRGALLKSRGTVSATGAIGTGVQLGAVSATQYLYATFHVFSSGTTLTAVLESDDNAGFTSATTRATIGPLTTTGGTWITRVAGAITDDYYRLRVTAITGSFIVAGAAGIK